MKLTIKNKLLIGFASVLTLSVVISVNTYYRIVEASNIQTRISTVRHPTVTAGMTLLDGIDLSLAGLRGYMILGDTPQQAENFKAERARGWEQIDNSIDQLSQFSQNWTVPNNIALLDEMKLQIDKFRVAQQKVEDIAQAPDNIPAYQLLLTDVSNNATTVTQAITALINEEARLPADAERKHLLKLLADSRGSFAIGLANLRAYILSGEIGYWQQFQKNWQVNQQRFNQLENQQTLFSAAQQPAWINYQQSLTSFGEFPEQIFQLRQADDWNRANYWLGTEAAPTAKKIKQLLTQMRISQDELMATDTQLLEQEIELLIIIMVVSTVIALLIGIAITYYLSRAITVPLFELLLRAKAIASGNLTDAALKVKGNDELTELTAAINEMHQSLHQVICQVSNSTSELNQAAGQLSDNALKTNHGMTMQQRETEQIATAMNEMTATVQDVAQNANEAALSAKQADSEAEQGRTVVETNTHGIRQLVDNSAHAAQTINRLGENAKNVDEIVEVISSIASQTNLLALNAAIEAARAGEQGRGFAVVADEVRSLAARTQQSTDEIRSMLDTLKEGAEQAVEVMANGQAQAQESVAQANHAEESLEMISTAVSKINDMNCQIATATEEQSAVADEMNQSIVRISTEAQESLQSASATEQAAEQVGSLANRLDEIVSQFQIDIPTDPSRHQPA